MNCHAPPNIPLISVTDDTSHFDRSWLNRPPANIRPMSVTEDTSHFDTSPSKPSPNQPENIACILVTAETSHADRFAWINFAFSNIELISVTAETSHTATPPPLNPELENIALILVTDDTFHPRRFPILKQKLLQSAPGKGTKSLLMSVMADTSHDPIGPVIAEVQSPLSGDRFRQTSTARWSSAKVFGANTAW